MDGQSTSKYYADSYGLLSNEEEEEVEVQEVLRFIKSISIIQPFLFHLWWGKRQISIELGNSNINSSFNWHAKNEWNLLHYEYRANHHYIVRCILMTIQHRSSIHPSIQCAMHQPKNNREPSDDCSIK